MTRSTAPSRRERRRQVERILAEHGLLDGPRRVGPLHPEDVSFGGRLRRALAELGPFGVLLGRYLATRLDVLSVRETSELGELEGRFPALAGEGVLAILEQQIGPPDELFDDLDLVPLSSLLLHQTHRATLKDGRPVLVRLTRPFWAADLDRELASLAPLARVFAPRAGGPFGEVLEAFRRDLRERLDLGRTAEALELLARDADARDLLVVPRVERSTSRVLVVEDPGGRPLAEIRVPKEPPQGAAGDLARRFCLAWLQALVTAGTFAVEVEAQDLGDGRLAWTGGHFATMPSGSQINLWNYLRATARHQPDQAAACLLRELVAGPRAVTDGELRSRMRQIIPFRDGAWSESGENLTEFAVLHWNLAYRHGFRARPHLAAFYRGLYIAARTVEPFSGGADPMGEALGDLEWSAGWNQLRQLSAPAELMGAFEGYLNDFVELPRKIDRLLQLADPDGPGFVVKTQPPRRRRGGKGIVAVALALALIALALVGHHLAAAESFGVWGERLLAVLFAFFALLFLRLATS